MKKTALITLTIVRRALGYGIVVTLASIISIAIYVLNQREDLSIWHQADLDEEFDKDTNLSGFSDYLELEDRLFAQLDKEVYQKTEPGDKKSINRYQKGSRTDPSSMAKDWNRSFELPHTDPKAGILLLHGLSDSPTV